MEKKYFKNEPTKRVFIAVEFPDVVKDKILLFQNELKKVVSGNVKWVERENFHITLRFLGEIPEEMVENIKKIMDEVVEYFSPFYVSFDIFGAFPSLNSPRVLWIGIKDGLENLQTLYSLLEKRIVTEGFPKEDKSFSPHLTIGRAKDKIKITQEIKMPIKDRIYIDEIILFESKLTPQGPIYSPLYRSKFHRETT